MPINYKDGHWRSNRSDDEINRLLKSEVETLTEEEKIALAKILSDLETTGSSPVLDTALDLEYESAPIDPQTFLEDEYFFGNVGRDMRPRLRKDFVELFSGDYVEVILSGSLGWGKDFLATSCICRLIYELLCLRNPQKSLGLSADSKIYIVCVSVRKALAQRVVFEQIGAKMQQSPFFRAIRPHLTKKEIIFPKNIIISGGESTDLALLGLDVYGGVIDEANFMANENAPATVHQRDLKRMDRAELIYRTLMRRMKSRYMKEGGKRAGLLFLISSKRCETDFVERRLKEAREDPLVFVRDYAQWDTIEKFGKERFRVTVGSDAATSRILRPGEKPADENAHVVEVPVEFLDDFQKDIEGSLRDLAGISTSAVYPFFRLREKINAIEDDSINSPFPYPEIVSDEKIKFQWNKVFKKNDKDESVPICCPNAPRVLHIDPGLTECPLGMAMGHIHNWVTRTRKDDEDREISEDVPLIHIDFALRVKAPEGGEIIFSDIRSLVYKLAGMGYPISRISLDTWQSVDFLQQFKRHGFEVGTISTDSLDPFTIARTCIYEKRVKCSRNELLLEELRRLEYNAKKRKVVKRHDSWKDMADAFCGVIANLSGRVMQGPLQMIASESPESIEFNEGTAFIPGGTILFEDEYDEKKGRGEMDLPFLMG